MIGFATLEIDHVRCNPPSVEAKKLEGGFYVQVGTHILTVFTRPSYQYQRDLIAQLWCERDWFQEVASGHYFALGMIGVEMVIAEPPIKHAGIEAILRERDEVNNEPVPKPSKDHRLRPDRSGAGDGDRRGSHLRRAGAVLVLLWLLRRAKR